MNYRGKTALVTGASAGIGAAFAEALAARGARLVLTARRADRLHAIAAELQARFGVSARAVPADLARADAPDLLLAELARQGIEIDILVNNAGYGLPGRFLGAEWPAHRDFLEVMVSSYVHLARLVLPGMAARDWGRVVQVASVAGLVPGSAGHTLYGASKAFLVSFTQSLAAEFEGTGVKASALCPGFTYSEFHDVNGTRGLVARLPRFMFMEAAPVAERALAAVERGAVVCVPGAWNQFVVGMMKVLPRTWASAAVKRQSARFRNTEEASLRPRSPS